MIKLKKQKNFISLFTSYLVIGVSGITLNTILTSEISTEFFGDYSLALKLYFIAGLLGTVGLNISVMKRLSEDNQQVEENSKSLSSALSLGLLVSTAFMCLLYPLSGVISRLFDSEPSGIGLAALVLGLPFFTLNKILLASLNAYRKYGLFSIYQAMRPALILGLVCIAVYVKELPEIWVFYSFVISEIILFALLSITVFGFLDVKFRFDHRSWYKRHVNFGLKSLVSSAISDLHHSIDVIILGILGTSYLVGVYNYAADIAKHLFVLALILQTTMNPEVSSLWHKSKVKELILLLNKNLRNTYLMYVPFIAVAIGSYVVLVKYIVTIDGTLQSIYVFAILSAGVLLFSGYKTIISVFEFTGNPGIRVTMDAISLLSNIVLSCVLFYWFGLMGVALGTSLSFIVTITLIRIRAKNRLGLKLRWL